jgi:hypothetical protein|tara:strand:+ start:3089 stop:3643 length:555 start_codon:yes stop_codon:yes gene_type:complete
MPTPLTPQPIQDNTKVLGGLPEGFSTSGATSANATTNWRIHTQNVEIMYKRITQYKTLDGTADFNYLDVNYTVDIAREHLYWNASSGDALQTQTLNLISDLSTSGSLGGSGVIRTVNAGILRREVRDGDAESMTRLSGNLIVGKQPGSYDQSYDTSGNVNSTVLDMITGVKVAAPDFEISIVDL